MLLARTEGWPMAVQLARHWTNGALMTPVIASFSGSSGDIAAYLTEQIMEELPQHVQQLLIMTSITDETNGDLANALCDRNDAWDILTSLDQLGALLVPIDPDQSRFRFHDLFADYLRTRLKRLGEDQVRTLHRKASRWFGERDQLEGAMRHAALAGDHEASAEWLEKAGGVTVGVHNGGPYLRQLLAYIPGPVIAKRPRLRVARAIVLMKEGMVAEAAAEIAETMRLIDAGLGDHAARSDALIVSTSISAQGDDGLSLDTVKSLEMMIGDAAVARPWMQGALNDLLTLTHMRRGNFILARAACREARYLYDEDGIQNGRVFSRLHMGSVALGQGRLKEARDELECAAEMASAYLVADASTLAMIHVMLATALYEENQLGQAEAIGFSALGDCAQGEGWLEIYHSGYTTASGLHMARGDFDGALRQLEEGHAVAERRTLPLLKSLIAYRRLEILSLQNAVDPNLEGERLREELENASRASTFLERETATIALSRIAIQRGMAAEAESALRSLQHKVEELGRGKALIKILILRAFAARAADRMDDAASALRHALSLAAPEGWRRQFLEEGPAVIELLNAALRHIQISSLPSASVRFLAEVFSAQIDPKGHHSSDPSHILTPREREVMAGLRKQQSNKVIAREFGVTDNAVKYHLKNIYAKLGVNDREMAVAVALQHGLFADE
ncbi:LuxR family maltose regulon positive regulatory protein [Sphingosinicella soli]|uniref:LuxR family maltose regulon positive regulatory protein n=2 Tax=Sphingosinicella soli TaxID=333708 RepID=A0A7W7F7R6_9SPHN|nr:LuxR family maltose regulon positive regulatory protein [Sphingosinicella soli]